MRAKRIVLLLLASLIVIAVEASAQVPESALGPAPRAQDGTFTNLDGPITHGSSSLHFRFFWQRLARNLIGRGGAAPRVPNDGAFLRENARHSEPTATWIGHSTLLVQMDHVTFLTDPIWSKRASPLALAGPARLVAAGVALEDLPPIDFVLVSHGHYDHLDLPTLRRLAERRAETEFLVPTGHGELLRASGIANLRELDWGQVHEFAGVQIHCLPAQHWSQRGLRDRNRALWSSWAVIGRERRLYFAGDTGYFSGFGAIGRELGPFDLALLPIGAYLPVEMMRQSHLNPEEAVRAGRDLQARRILAMHFGTFDLANEPLDEPPRRFRAAALEAGFAADEVWILAVGETRKF